MPCLNRNGKVTCENCVTKTTKLNLARHKKSCSAGTFYRTHCPNLSTKSQNDLSCLFAQNTLRQLLGLFINAKCVSKTFTPLTECVNKKGNNMEHREVEVLKMLMLHNKW